MTAIRTVAEYQRTARLAHMIAAATADIASANFRDPNASAADKLLGEREYWVEREEADNASANAETIRNFFAICPDWSI